jgi:hypothetical protein
MTLLDGAGGRHTRRDPRRPPKPSSQRDRWAQGDTMASRGAAQTGGVTRGPWNRTNAGDANSTRASSSGRPKDQSAIDGLHFGEEPGRCHLAPFAPSRRPWRAARDTSPRPPEPAGRRSWPAGLPAEARPTGSRFGAGHFLAHQVTPAPISSAVGVGMVAPRRSGVTRDKIGENPGRMETIASRSHLSG